MSGSTCDWPGSVNGTCGAPADYELEVDGKKRPLCQNHFTWSAPPVREPDEDAWLRADLGSPKREPAPSVVDPVIDVMPVSESMPPLEDEEPAEVRLKNAVIDLALAGCETLLDRLKTWRKR